MSENRLGIISETLPKMGENDSIQKKEDSDVCLVEELESVKIPAHELDLNECLNESLENLIHNEFITDTPSSSKLLPGNEALFQSHGKGHSIQDTMSKEEMGIVTKESSKCLNTDQIPLKINAKYSSTDEELPQFHNKDCILQSTLSQEINGLSTAKSIENTSFETNLEIQYKNSSSNSTEILITQCPKEFCSSPSTLSKEDKSISAINSITNLNDEERVSLFSASSKEEKKLTTKIISEFNVHENQNKFNDKESDSEETLKQCYEKDCPSPLASKEQEVSILSSEALKSLNTGDETCIKVNTKITNYNAKEMLMQSHKDLFAQKIVREDNTYNSTTNLQASHMKLNSKNKSSDEMAQFTEENYSSQETLSEEDGKEKNILSSRDDQSPKRNATGISSEVVIPTTKPRNSCDETREIAVTGKCHVTQKVSNLLSKKIPKTNGQSINKKLSLRERKPKLKKREIIKEISPEFKPHTRNNIKKKYKKVVIFVDKVRDVIDRTKDPIRIKTEDDKISSKFKNSSLNPLDPLLKVNPKMEMVKSLEIVEESFDLGIEAKAFHPDKCKIQKKSSRATYSTEKKALNSSYVNNIHIEPDSLNHAFAVSNITSSNENNLTSVITNGKEIIQDQPVVNLEYNKSSSNSASEPIETLQLHKCEENGTFNSKLNTLSDDNTFGHASLNRGCQSDFNVLKQIPSLENNIAKPDTKMIPRCRQENNDKCSIEPSLNMSQNNSAPEVRAGNNEIGIKRHRQRKTSKLNYQLKEEVQEQCCGHWFPNTKHFIKHLVENSTKERDSLHVAKLLDFGMQKCPVCSIWLNINNFKKHMKKEHSKEISASYNSIAESTPGVSEPHKSLFECGVPSVSIIQRLNDKKDKFNVEDRPCPMSKKKNPYCKQNSHILCDLSLDYKTSNKLLNIWALDDLPLHLKPLVILSRLKIRLKNNKKNSSIKNKFLTTGDSEFHKKYTKLISSSKEKCESSNQDKAILSQQSLDSKVPKFKKKTVKLNHEFKKKSKIFNQKKFKNKDENQRTGNIKLQSNLDGIEANLIQAEEALLINGNNLGEINKVMENSFMDNKENTIHVDKLKSSKFLQTVPLKPKNGSSNLSSNNELDLDGSMNELKIIKKLKKDLKPQSLQYKGTNKLKGSQNYIRAMKFRGVRGKKTRFRGRKRGRFKYRNGWSVSSDGFSSSYESSSDSPFDDFEDEKDEAISNQLNEIIPAVDLELFTWSFNEEFTFLLIDPKDPNFKVFASLDTVFVGDTALGDVTNQMNYIYDNNSIIYVNPNHFLFPDVLNGSKNCNKVYKKKKKLKEIENDFNDINQGCDSPEHSFNSFQDTNKENEFNVVTNNEILSSLNILKSNVSEEIIEPIKNSESSKIETSSCCSDTNLKECQVSEKSASVCRKEAKMEVEAIKISFSSQSKTNEKKPDIRSLVDKKVISIRAFMKSSKAENYPSICNKTCPYEQESNYLQTFVLNEDISLEEKVFAENVNNTSDNKENVDSEIISEKETFILPPQDDYKLNVNDLESCSTTISNVDPNEFDEMDLLSSLENETVTKEPNNDKHTIEDPNNSEHTTEKQNNAEYLVEELDINTEFMIKESNTNNEPVPEETNVNNEPVCSLPLFDELEANVSLEYDCGSYDSVDNFNKNVSETILTPVEISSESHTVVASAKILPFETMDGNGICLEDYFQEGKNRASQSKNNSNSLSEDILTPCSSTDDKTKVEGNEFLNSNLEDMDVRNLNVENETLDEKEAKGNMSNDSKDSKINSIHIENTYSNIDTLKLNNEEVREETSSITSLKLEEPLKEIDKTVPSNLINESQCIESSKENNIEDIISGISLWSTPLIHSSQVEMIESSKKELNSFSETKYTPLKMSSRSKSVHTLKDQSKNKDNSIQACSLPTNKKQKNKKLKINPLIETRSNDILHSLPLQNEISPIEDIINPKDKIINEVILPSKKQKKEKWQPSIKSSGTQIKKKNKSLRSKNNNSLFKNKKFSIKQDSKEPFKIKFLVENLTENKNLKCEEESTLINIGKESELPSSKSPSFSIAENDTEKKDPSSSSQSCLSIKQEDELIPFETTDLSENDHKMINKFDLHSQICQLVKQENDLISSEEPNSSETQLIKNTDNSVPLPNADVITGDVKVEENSDKSQQEKEQCICSNKSNKSPIIVKHFETFPSKRQRNKLSKNSPKYKGNGITGNLNDSSSVKANKSVDIQLGSTENSKQSSDDRQWLPRGSKLKAQVMLNEKLARGVNTNQKIKPKSLNSPKCHQKNIKCEDQSYQDIRLYFTSTKTNAEKVKSQKTCTFPPPQVSASKNICHESLKEKTKSKRKRTKSMDIRTFLSPTEESCSSSQLPHLHSPSKKMKLLSPKKDPENNFEGFNDTFKKSYIRHKILQEYVDVLHTNTWFKYDRFILPVDQLCDWNDDLLNVALFEKG